MHEGGRSPMLDSDVLADGGCVGRLARAPESDRLPALLANEFTLRKTPVSPPDARQCCGRGRTISFTKLL